MRLLPTTRLPVLITGLLASTMALDGADVEIEKQSQEQLEQRLSEIDSRLNEVAHMSLRSGSGSIGYRSKSYHSEDHQAWVEIQFNETRLINEVILVPALSRSAQSDFHADAFPQELRIWAGTDEDRRGQLVGTLRAEPGTLPRIAPLALTIKPTTASWIQIEATQMSRRVFDDQFCLQLSELMVFSGNENVALHRPVLASSDGREHSGAWGKEFLTDGHTPFLMDAAQGEQSNAYQGSHIESPALIIDLEGSYPLSHVNFHMMETSDTVPTALAGDYGMPDHIRIEGATRSDFSDAILLLDVERRDPNEIGPIMTWALSGAICQYVRIVGVSPASEDSSSDNSSTTDAQAEKADSSVSIDAPDQSWIGFAEIELFALRRNVAINKQFTRLNITSGRDIGALTDGRNFYGDVLTIREWMSQLAERHDLEFERKLVTDELAVRYTKQKQTLKRLIWLASLLTVGIFIIIYVERRIHRRQLDNVKQRFAADLHDEIGANLHTINLTSQLISKRSDQLPEEINQLTGRIQTVVKRTNRAIRHVTDIQATTALSAHLADELKRTAERILIGLGHEVEVMGEKNLGQLSPRRHSDLVLLYQECLINICRHSDATKVETSLTASKKYIELIVTDNGKGLSKESQDTPPPSLARRAKLLRAKIKVERPDGGGTKIIIKLRRRSRLRRALSPKL